MGFMRKMYEKFHPSSGEQVHDGYGYEMPDPVPIAPPVGHVAQPTLREQMRAMIMEHAHQIEMGGFESEEEANDFDVGDDFEPFSEAEIDAAAAEAHEGLKRREAEDKARSRSPSKAPKNEPSAPVQGASGMDPAQPDPSKAPAAKPAS